MRSCPGTLVVSPGLRHPEACEPGPSGRCHGKKQTGRSWEPAAALSDGELQGPATSRGKGVPTLGDCGGRHAGAGPRGTGRGPGPPRPLRLQLSHSALRPLLPLGPLLSALLLLLLGTTRPAAGIAPELLYFMGNVTYPLNEQLSCCDTLGPLYDGISNDLRHWAETGISREALDLAVARYTTVGAQKGMTLAFYGGVAHVVDEVILDGLGHHINILLTYMLVMLDLQRQYGKQIPDCEFVIASSDRPLVLTAAQEAGKIPPLMRFCSSDYHADIQIPIFHFYTKKYTPRYLTPAKNLSDAYPWASRKPIVFGRFSKYYRHIHPLAPSTLKRGARNSTICKQESAFTVTCPVRAHFMEWAARKHPNVIDVRSGPRVSLSKHAAYKYLLHLDGQATSSRLEQLMPLRSLILKEESGYHSFYYHLLRPYEHYVPVWPAGSGPEDVLSAMAWAQEHDEEAERMAAAAQEVALTYLSKRARSCYWFRLLKEYAALQRFKPSPSGKPHVRTVEDYLLQVGRRHDRGKHLHKIEN
ncbi:hypothetical protein HYH03_015752 [Edaphochlamys debaryana]|uniref:Glycosyl transferase CAP10 domain-containing protein n=1 Tax=Edaphochlamys debaryana TaxID=47281 RepID=A0A835XIS5_9CHLO|nr:hypothetical protein HYH03_015752 [Edaphochlamys debaryana]|eukprot:KAG2485477.1 hypothetical protein HYH03_015752 [Edaphochlamys debaryana]